MPTTVKENYLKALYFLHRKDSRISLTELSEQLGVSKPSAGSMIKSLQERGWVKYRRYKPLQLTVKGQKAAAKVIRKHRLAEMFLHQVMGFGWEEVHEIAEQMEHIDSEKFFDRMDFMLNQPRIDPHGSPIPDAQGNMVEQQLVPLLQMTPGQKGQLAALAHSSPPLLNYLNQHAIKIGTKIELIRIESFDRSCTISCDGNPPMVVSEKVGESLLMQVS